MCQDGTCQACRDLVARDNSLSSRWRQVTPKASVAKVTKKGKGDEGDPLETNFLDFTVIKVFLRESEKEKPKRNKEAQG